MPDVRERNMDPISNFHGTSLFVFGSVAALLVLMAARYLPVRVDPQSVMVSQALVGGSDFVPGEKARPLPVRLRVIVERPLFNETRRPEVVRASRKIEERPLLVSDRTIFDGRDLVGIIEGPGGPRLLVDGASPGTAVIVGPGERFGNWRFDRLEGQVAIFVAAGEVFRLPLKERSEGIDATAIARNTNSASRRRGRRP